MTSRERFHATFRYGQPDRVWLFPQWTFLETRERWLREGQPRDQHFNTYWGYDRYEQIPLNSAPWPALESKIIERSPEWQVVEDELGGRIKHWTDRGIGMSQWLRAPVRDRETWEQFKLHLNAEAPVRYPEYWEDYKRSVRDRDYPLRIDIGSVYGWIRNWVGMEHLALWYFDCPDLVHEMTEFVTDFIVRLITRALEEIPEIDCAHLWEDMAMKTGPLISPRLFREFMLEPLKRITSLVHQAGVDIIMVDSDGNNDDLVPLWLEAGVNLLFPLEVAASSDPVRLRETFGRQLLLMGAIDKRALRDGCTHADIEREVVAKVGTMVKLGGFSPLVDHAVPPDVPFENFRYYMDLVHELCAFH
ncbi:MAG TPA: uroporphyrinogen decarboxylase family protein [Armatimonadota bacterium]|jgi:uroporphyrinogen decarboxylase